PRVRHSRDAYRRRTATYRRSVDPTRWNVTDAEAAATFPGDDTVGRAGRWVPITRGIDVAAPAATVFRWLCQLKVAPSSYDWIDNRGRRSPRTLIPVSTGSRPGRTSCRS